MNKFLYLAVFVVALAIAYASAQSQSQPQNSQPGQVPQTSPSTQSNSHGSTQAQPGAQGGNPQVNVPGGATDASGGGVVGAAGSTTGKTQVPETPEPGSPAPSDGELQSQIQNALSKEPTLSGDTVHVAVSAASIDITGSVATAREKQTATRIVESYAGNKKVTTHLTVGDRNRNAAPAPATPPR